MVLICSRVNNIGWWHLRSRWLSDVSLNARAGVVASRSMWRRRSTRHCRSLWLFLVLLSRNGLCFDLSQIMNSGGTGIPTLSSGIASDSGPAGLVGGTMDLPPGAESATNLTPPPGVHSVASVPQSVHSAMGEGIHLLPSAHVGGLPPLPEVHGAADLLADTSILSQLERHQKLVPIGLRLLPLDI